MSAQIKDVQEFDVDNFDFEIVESAEPLPIIKRGRAAAPKVPNKFVGPLEASMKHSTNYTIYVPLVGVEKTVNKIHGGARELNISSRVVVNFQRNDDGSYVKDENGRQVPLVEKSGQYKGLVMIRFAGQAKRERKTVERAYSIRQSKIDPNVYNVKERSTGQIVYSGPKTEAYDKRDELEIAVAENAERDPQ